MIWTRRRSHHYHRSPHPLLICLAGGNVQRWEHHCRSRERGRRWPRCRVHHHQCLQMRPHKHQRYSPRHHPHLHALRLPRARQPRPHRDDSGFAPRANLFPPRPRRWVGLALCHGRRARRLARISLVEAVRTSELSWWWPGARGRENCSRCYGVISLECDFMFRTRQVLQVHPDERRHGSCWCGRERRCVRWRRASDCCSRRRCRCEHGHGRCHGRGARKQQQSARSYQRQHALVAITRIIRVVQHYAVVPPGGDSAAVGTRWHRRRPQLWELSAARTHR